MNLNQANVYPVSQARTIFGRLVDETSKTKTVFLTKKGKIKAALVDFEYLQEMQRDLASLYKKTFIDKHLTPYTRIFSDEEIKEWLEEDRL